MDKEKREAILDQILGQTDYQTILTELNITIVETQLAQIDKNEKTLIGQKKVELDALKLALSKSVSLREVIVEKQNA